MTWLVFIIFFALWVHCEVSLFRLGRELRADRENRERAAELEKAWNDGVSSIVGYDRVRAEEAARNG